MSPSNPEDLEMLNFKLTGVQSVSQGPRLGSLLFAGRNSISTPHYIATTSRGVVPHVAPDLLRKQTSIKSIYIALEDFIEKTTPDVPPIFSLPSQALGSPFRDFIALHDSPLLIFGPRRVPAVPSPIQTSNSAISILTSVGFRQLEVEDFNDAVLKLCPDVAVAISDVITAQNASRKRIEKSADRTHAWLRDTLSAFQTGDDKTPPRPPVFAPIPPLEKEQQSFYLTDLVEEYKPDIGGLALSSHTSVDTIPGPLNDLPRLCLSNPSSPHDILRAVASGIDLVTLPLISQYSDAGIAFTFTFPPLTDAVLQPSSKLPLGVDMWSPDHAVDLSPLAPNCTCYTCTHHHRAYVAHLLQAKEMLAWTLLQLHNYATVDKFFSGIRHSIEEQNFERCMEEFSLAYEGHLPEKSGTGPRSRGYQMKSTGGGEAKKNPRPYGKLDDASQKLMEASESVGGPNDSADAAALEESGFAKKTDHV